MRFRSGIRAVSRRKRLTGAHAARPDKGQGLKMAAAIVAPLLVAIGLIALVAANNSGDKTSTSSTIPSTTTTVTASKEAVAFQGKVDEAFKALGDAIKTFLPRAQDFEAGKVSPADFMGNVDIAVPEFVKARDAVAKLEKYKKDPTINKYYLDAAELYVDTARIYGAATDPASEALRAQLNVSARRLRTLGDRIYDRARAVLDPTFYAPPSSDVELRPPTEVPDWVAEGMAAGPPLAPAPGPPASSPPIREATCGKGVTPPCRKEESTGKWESALKKAGFPQPPDIVAALDAGDAARLGRMAEDFEAKVRDLRSKPDPKKKREYAAVVELGLLTNGEAARIGQAAAMLPAGDVRNRLLAVARRSVLVADGLIGSGLGFKPSGLPPSLLTDNGL